MYYTIVSRKVSVFIKGVIREKYEKSGGGRNTTPTG